MLTLVGSRNTDVTHLAPQCGHRLILAGCRTTEC